jgi:uncharacterized protein YdhG (YjbR/CyaY superfamily)
MTIAKSANRTNHLRAYFAALPSASRRELEKIRAAIKSVASDAVETISYGIPAFKLNGRILVYYAAWKSHTSLYPMTDAIRSAFADELKGYKTSKGTIQFPLAKPVPSTLVKRLIKARIAELESKKKSRS